jgi:hypothetical protein
MVQDGAIEFDRALDGLFVCYPLHEDLANRVLEQRMEAGFDFAASWSAPLDHAFLSPRARSAGLYPCRPSSRSGLTALSRRSLRRAATSRRAGTSPES